MKNFNVILFVAVLSVVVGCNQKGSSGAVAISTLEDSVSYSLGVQMGQNIVGGKVDGINPDIYAQGMKDVMNDTSKFTDQEINQVMTAFQNLQREKQMKRNEELLAAGENFLADNAAKEGVTTTESGLQYRELVAGSGASPAPTDNVTVHYTGKLVDGTVFDSSVERGEPVTFPLNRVIPGWTEGLQLMKEGGKAELVIPPAIGYGPRGSGEIPPNAVLVFEVELISIGEE